MINLLRIEWLKIKNYGAFKIVALFFVFGVVFANLIVYIVQKNFSDNTPGAAMISFSPYNFDSTWQTTSYTAGCLLVLPAMLIIMLISNEYTFRTNRQNVIDGWSRNEFISVKLMMALLFAVASTVLVFFTAIGFGLASGTSFSFNSVSHVGYFFLKAVSYNMFAVLVSVLVKKTGFAIAVYFIYIGVENFLSLILDSWSLKMKLSKTADLGSIGDYLPLNSSDGLLSFPDNPLKAFARGAFPTNYTMVVFVLAIIYLVLFMWWSRSKYMKADL